MEKERGAKAIALVALVVAILGLSIGFSGWTAQLSISDTQANIGGGADADSFANLIAVSNVSCNDKSTDATVENVGSASAHSWTGTRVGLTKTGDYVTCTATVTNSSEFTAYLDDIKIAGSIQCSGAGQNVQAACDALKLTVTGHGTKDSTATAQADSVTNALNISENSIAAEGTGTISLKVEYAGSALSDTDFVATIPSITFDYSTVD